jgi:hypothetical protein
MITAKDVLVPTKCSENKHHKGMMGFWDTSKSDAGCMGIMSVAFSLKSQLQKKIRSVYEGNTNGLRKPFAKSS